MIDVNTVEVNFLGKLFRKPSINANSEAIWFSINGIRTTYFPIQAMRAFVCMDKAILGNKIQFNIDGVDITTKFLKKNTIVSFLDTVNESISLLVSDYLRKVFCMLGSLGQRKKVILLQIQQPHLTLSMNCSHLNTI